MSERMLDTGSKEAFAPVEFDEKTIEDQFSDEIDNDGNLFGETDDAALVVRVPYDANDGDGGHNHPASGSNNTRKYRPGRWRWRCWGLVLVALSIGVLVSAGMLWQGSRKHRLDDDSILDRKSHDPSASSIIHSAAENPNYGQNGIDMDERNSHSYTNKHPLDPWLFSGEGNHDTPNNHNTPNNHDSPTTYERGVESRLERERHFANLAVQWSDGVALSWKHSPARMALDWILDDDPMHLPTYGDGFVFQQRYIAAVFYFATRGQQQTVHEDLHDDSSSSGGSEDSAPFLANTDVCLWANSNGKSGIFCDDEGNIVKLNFRDFGLAGTLPRELGFLSGLTSINLEGNDISGTIPSHYGLLVNLERMGLEFNKITGTIPEELSNLGALMELDLDKNHLTGSLPADLLGLKYIESIEIASSALTGTIPTVLSGSIKKLSLGGNNLSGNIPSELGILTKLWFLDFSHNDLTGTVPIELESAKSLEMAFLNGNDFAGSIDVVFCSSGHRIFEELVSDCKGSAPEVKCSCCTGCCDASGLNCVLHDPFSAIDTDRPSPTPTRKSVGAQDASTGATASTSSAAQPAGTPSQEEPLKELLSAVSERTLLEEKHTDQFKAFMWMARMDPSPVDVATTSRHDIMQKYIMVLFYISTGGKNWRHQNSFLTDVSLCDWEGLTCNDEHKIVAIDLEDNHLNGTLASELGALGPSLQDLRLGGNALFGSVPSELGVLPSLRTLDLTDNAGISGTIPPSVSLRSLPNLETLELAGTGIEGDLDPLFCAAPGGEKTGTGGGVKLSQDVSIIANCLDPSVIICSCCNVCCDAAGENCKSL